MTYAFSVKSGEQRRVSSNPEFWFEAAQWLSDGNRLFLVSIKDPTPRIFRHRNRSVYRASYRTPRWDIAH